MRDKAIAIYSAEIPGEKPSVKQSIISLNVKNFCRSISVVIWSIALGAQVKDAQAAPVNVTVDGVTYTINSTGYLWLAPNLNPSATSLLQSQIWYGDSAKAQAFALAARNAGFGTASPSQPGYGSFSPYFAYFINPAGIGSSWSYYYNCNTDPTCATSNVSTVSWRLDRNWVFATATVYVPPGIVAGTTYNASAPSATIFAGGTLTVDQDRSSTNPFGSGFDTGTGGSIDGNGKTAFFSGIFSGSGNMSFINSGVGGRITFSGTNTYTGATSIANGTTLAVNGSIATSSGLTVNAGGEISGSGILPTTIINNGAIIAPGNSIGTLTVAGNYSLNGGTEAIEVQGPQNDRIVVTGTVAPFTGTASLISFGGGTAWPALTYTVVSANASAPFATSTSLTLDQSQITPSALLQFGTTLIQEADGNSRTFDVQWRPNNGSGAVASAMAALGAGNGNASSAAGLFDSAFNRLAAVSAGNTNATGAAIGTTGFTADQATAAGLSSDVVTRLAALLAIPGGAQLLQAVNSVTPESYAAFQSVGLNALRLQRETITSQAGTCKETGWLINGTSRASGSGNKRSGSNKSKLPLCVFATGGNATSTINSSEGLSGYNTAIAGGFYGIELQPSAQWTVGAAYGYGTAALSSLGAGLNSVTSTLNSASLYGVYKPDSRWSVKTLLGYANATVTGQRNLIAIGNGNLIRGNTSANGYTAAVLADYAIPLSKTSARIPLQLKPQLGLAYGAYQQNGLSETGDPTMNLNVASHTSQSLIGTVGAQLVAAIPLNPANTQLLKPRLAVAYQVDALATSNGNTTIDAVLPAATSSFSTNSLGRGANDVTVSGSLEYVIASKASLYATASYEVFSTGSQFAYGGGVKLSF
jgi:autotransporter-associated beta strand protein